MDNSMYQSLGWDGLFAILVTLGFIAVAWMLLQELKWEKAFRDPRSPRVRLLQLCAAILIGHGLARFMLDYWQWTGSIRWLFHAG